MRKSVLVVSSLSLWAVTALADQQPDPYAGPRDYFARESKLASKGDVEAMICMGELYRSGFGVTKDADKQFYWQSAAAAKGSDAGKLGVATDFVLGHGVQKDPAKGIAMVQALVAKGYVPAWSAMGTFYDSGTGVPQDRKMGLAWYTKAAEADYVYAQTQLGLMYQLGLGVKRDGGQAQMWLSKAAQHKFDCAEEFMSTMSLIIYGNVDPDSLDRNEIYGFLGMKYRYKEGKAEDTRVTISSGDERDDAAWLKATRLSKLPPWPDYYKSTDKTVGVASVGAGETFDPDFMSAVEAAIRATQILPKEVLLNGSKGTGLATVSFDYLDGGVSDEKLVASSEDASEDAAALAAVADAKYPPPPQEYVHVKIPMKIILQFEQVDPVEPPATAPTATTTNKRT